MKGLKVCMMARVTTAHSRGGMEVHTKILTEELAKQGVEVHLIAPSYDGKKRYEIMNGVHIHYVCSLPPRFLWNHSWSKEAYRKFVELDKKIGFDIFHSMASGGIPFMIHNVFRRKMKIVLTLHGTLIDEMKSFLAVMKDERDFGSFVRLCFNVAFHIATHPFIFFLYRKSDAIIATSKPQISNIKKSFLLDSRKIILIRNGIDTSLFSPSNRARSSVLLGNIKGKSIFWVGRFDRQKGIQIAIEGMNIISMEHPKARLYVMGDMKGYFWHLKSLVETTDLKEKVIFLPSVEYSTLPKYINSCDIYIHPTLRDEAAPLVLPQAISCGKPVVASHIGGISDVIINGENGYLFEPGNVEEFSRRVSEILRNDILRKRMGNNARRIAEERFSSIDMARRVISVYKNLTGLMTCE